MEQKSHITMLFFATILHEHKCTKRLLHMLENELWPGVFATTSITVTHHTPEHREGSGKQLVKMHSPLDEHTNKLQKHVQP